MDADDHQKLREAVAKEHGITLYRQYGEQEAAHFLGRDYSRLRTARRSGKIPHIRVGEKGVKYLGIQIADILILGNEAVKLWDATPSGPTKSETGSSLNEEPPGTDADTTRRGVRPNASALARNVLNKRNRG
jgi:hypothetical protein